MFEGSCTAQSSRPNFHVKTVVKDKEIKTDNEESGAEVVLNFKELNNELKNGYVVTFHFLVCEIILPNRNGHSSCSKVRFPQDEDHLSLFYLSIPPL